MTFTHQRMQEILPILKKKLLTETSLTFNVLNPDFSNGYAGHEVVIKMRPIDIEGTKRGQILQNC